MDRQNTSKCLNDIRKVSKKKWLEKNHRGDYAENEKVVLVKQFWISKEGFEAFLFVSNKKPIIFLTLRIFVTDWLFHHGLSLLLILLTRHVMADLTYFIWVWYSLRQGLRVSCGGRWRGTPSRTRAAFWADFARARACSRFRVTAQGLRCLLIHNVNREVSKTSCHDETEQGPDCCDGDERVLYCDRASSPHHQQDLWRAQGQPCRDVTMKELLFTHSFLQINRINIFCNVSNCTFSATRSFSSWTAADANTQYLPNWFIPSLAGLILFATSSAHLACIIYVPALSISTLERCNIHATTTIFHEEAPFIFHASFLYPLGNIFFRLLLLLLHACLISCMSGVFSRIADILPTQYHHIFLLLLCLQSL